MVTDILQPTHLLFILVVALLVLGPKRLPEVARTLGNGLRDFRSALSGDSDQGPGHPGHYTLSDEATPHEPATPYGDSPVTPATTSTGESGLADTVPVHDGVPVPDPDPVPDVPVHNAEPVHDARPAPDPESGHSTAPIQYPAPAHEPAAPHDASTKATEVHQFTPPVQAARDPAAPSDRAQAPSQDPSGTRPA